MKTPLKSGQVEEFFHMTMLKSLCVAAFIAFFTVTAMALPKTKHDQLVAFQTLLAELKTNYGLIKYKEQVFGLNYDTLEQKYTRLIDTATTLEEDAGLEPKQKREVLPPEEFRQLMIGLAAEFKDGHTNITRNTKSASTLGIEASAFGDKLIVTGFNNEFYVDSGLEKPLQVGDEIIAVDGKNVRDIAAENFLYAPRATYETAKNFALESAVKIPFALLRAKPNGEPAVVTFKRGDTTFKGRFHWLVGQSDGQGFIHPKNDGSNGNGNGDEGEDAAVNPFVYGHMGMTPSYFSEGLKNIGLPEGSVLNVGQLINLQIKGEMAKARKAGQALPPDEKEITRLEAYIVPFQGKSIGVIRIPNYSPNTVQDGYAEVNWLTKVIPYFEQHTDGVIIDQLSNNGGFVFYVSELVRLFASTEMRGVTIDMKLTETLLKNFQDDSKEVADAAEKSGVSDPDMPNFAETELGRLNMKRLQDIYDSGQEWTGMIPYMGTNTDLPGDQGAGTIDAGGKMTYTKPVLILNDMRSGSGGDFMPAIMQANGRAKIFGATSMGLGAPVYREMKGLAPSEENIRCPFGFCLRSDNQPIENRGDVPDIIRIPTREDLVGGFSGYSSDALKTMVGLIDGRSVSELQAQVDEGKTLAPFKVQLPEDLLKMDLILPTLMGKDEVIARLEQMKELPRFKEDPMMVKRLGDLIEQIRAAGDDQRFKPYCDISLGMI